MRELPRMNSVSPLLTISRMASARRTYLLSVNRPERYLCITLDSSV